VVISTIWKSNQKLNGDTPSSRGSIPEYKIADEVPILTIALLADSHNSNDNLQKALAIAKEKGSNYVIHLGDLSNVGTTAELTFAKDLLDQSGLKYYVIPGDHEYYVSEWNGKPSIDNFSSLFGDAIDWLVLDDGSVKSKFQNESEFLFLHEPLYPLGKNDELLEKVRKSKIKAVIAGDTHFSSKTKDPIRDTLTHINIGSLADERNLQSPRFSILRVYEDGEYNLEEVVL